VLSGLLIYNPTAGQGNLSSRLPLVQSMLGDAGVALELVATERAGHAGELAREAVSAGLGIVAVCGGDGTINETAIALAGSNTALAILPGGTANVLARELGVPRSLPSAARVLIEGARTAISVGRAGERRFLMMAGFGFDAQVLAGFSPLLKRHLGRVAYAARCAEELAKFRPPQLRVIADGRSIEGTMVVAANIRLYGGDFVLAPEADPTDDLLDVVVFSGSTRMDYTRYLLGMIARRLHQFPDVAVLRARKVRVEGDDVRGQIDGDAVLTTPVALFVEPRALKVIVPAGSKYATE
jgi:diacylglycerol kinase (ATP)